MKTEEKIKNIPMLENWELVRDFEIESLNLDYRACQRNKILANLSTSDEEIKKAQEKLDEQQKLFNAYREEIIWRMQK